MEIPARSGHTYSGINASGGSHHFGDVIHPPARPETPPEPVSLTLPHHDAYYVENEELLKELRTKASTPDAWTALVGLGGVGKTQLALRFLRRERDNDAKLWTVWIFASNAARFKESIADVAEQLRLPGRQNPKANVLQLLQNWLASSKRQWVVVLDNADDADFLRESSSDADGVWATKPRIDYFPKCRHGTVIVTTRDKNEALRFVSEDDVVEVLPMAARDAETLLQKKLGSMYKESSGARLAEALDFMPLALSQAASYIRQNKKFSVERYLAELERSRAAKTSLLRREATVPKRDREASSSIILTWQVSFEHIRSKRKSAADLLALMSLCDRQAIPEFLLHGEERDTRLEDGQDHTGDNNANFEDDLQMLDNFSFVSASKDHVTEAVTWSMHRLVQDATRWWLQARGEMGDSQRKYISRLHAVVPTGEYENWQTCKMLAPHVRTADQILPRTRDQSLLWATVAYRTAWYEMRGGSLMNAATYAETAFTIRQELLEEDDLDTLCSMSVLAEVHRSQGRWTEAEELFVKVMETSRRVLGAEHPDTLTSMANLASTFWNQGRWTEAEELDVKVMETSRRVLGAEHPDTLTSMANLASTYRNQGRWTEAEELEVKVMETRRRVLGAEHPDTLTSMNNLAATYYNQQRLQEALDLAKECLTLQAARLGATHPHTLSTKSWVEGIEEAMQTMDVDAAMPRLAVNDAE